MKKLIKEAKRFQQLANILKENDDAVDNAREEALSNLYEVIAELKTTINDEDIIHHAKQALKGKIKEDIKSLNESNSSVNQEIEFGEDDLLDVNFTANVNISSGKTSYSYGSIDGVHDFGDEVEIEDLEWNKEDFTNEQNAFIENWVNKNMNYLEDELVKNRETYEPDFD